MPVAVLLQNVALLVALTVVQQFIEQTWRGGRTSRVFLSGLLYGTVAIVGMAAPLQVAPGVIFDGRSIVLAVAGAFGGPGVGAIAASMAAGYRVLLGGAGTAVGIAVIAEATILGIALHYVRRRDPRVVRPLRLWVFGVVVHAVMLLLMFALPGGIAWAVLVQVGVPVIVVYPLGVLLIGRIMVEQENRFLTSIAQGEGTEVARFVADNSLDSIWLIDMDMTFRYVNPAVETMFGYTPEEFLGRPLREYVTADNLKTMMGILESAVRRLPENDGDVFETEIIRKDGTPLAVEIAARIMLDGSGRPIAIYGSTRDISGRARELEREREMRERLEVLVAERTAELRSANEEALLMNRELQLINEEVTHANEAKTRFLRAMSHELRTPLNSIIGFSDILSRGIVGELSEEQQRQTEMINHSGRHLLALINDILDLSRIEAERIDVEYATFEAGAVAEEALLSMGTEAQAKGLALQFEAPDGPIEIESDERKVRQILLNLIGNAVKFTDAGTVGVTVRAPSEGLVALEVTDSGHGISPSDQQRVFDEFVQAGDTEEAARSGSGLGLSIARGLARALGGSLTLRSEPGSGSTFTLTLPRSRL